MNSVEGPVEEIEDDSTLIAGIREQIGFRTWLHLEDGHGEEPVFSSAKVLRKFPLVLDRAHGGAVRARVKRHGTGTRAMAPA